MLQMTSRT